MPSVPLRQEPDPTHPHILIPDPEQGRDETTWQNEPLPVSQLQPLGHLMAALLGGTRADITVQGTHTDDGDDSPDTSSDKPLFQFPFIHRRVETLNILSELSEHRRLSLDIDQTVLLHRLLQGTPAVRSGRTKTHDGGTNMHDYGDFAPIPFAIFRKGILHEFSAFDEKKQPLSLVGKRICLQMGLAWLLAALPWGTDDWSKSALLRDDNGNLSKEFVKHLWHIIQYVPRGSELPFLAD